jgi:hypothetical protein
MFNVPTSTIIDNVKSASRRNLPWFSETMCNFSGECAIVAGGESLKRFLQEIKDLPKDVMIFSCNGTHDYLIENGIKPDFFTMVDARPCNDFAKLENKDCVYMLASQVHKSMFDKLDNVILWHTEHEYFPRDYVHKQAEKRKQGHYWTIAGKGSIGLTTICLAHTMGFRSFRLYGFDSSFENYQHSYKQKQNEKDKILHHELNGVIYQTTPTLMAQIGTYLNFLPLLKDCKVAVRSDGLIKAIQESYESAKRCE